MKNIYCLIVLTFGVGSLYAQEEVKLDNLKVPVSPAFSILDFSPKTIESPGTVKAFTANLATIAGQSGGIPKNFAFEFAPYWFFKHPDMNVYKYYGLNTGDQLILKPNIFYGIRSTSLSLGSVFKDSSQALPVDVNYLSYAFRSNIINVRNGRVLKHLKASIDDVNGALQNVLAEAIQKCGGPGNIDCIGEFIAKSKDSTFKATRDRFAKLLTARPVFNVDLAAASSTAFGNNKFSDRKTYRSGAWLTLAYYQPLIGQKKVEDDINNLLECKNYVSAFLLFRIMNENSTKDFKTFSKSNLFDMGGRIEFEFSRFSLSVESVRRVNRDNKDLNSSRTVGIIQYRISDELFLLGTFGKDFGDVENVISLLGLNWGFGEKALNKPFNP